MKLVYIGVEILCYILIIPCAISGRKYDLEAEAMKLYGEDLHSVLRRFRKTPDYLKILRDKTEDMNIYRSDIGVHSMFYYHEISNREAHKILGDDKTEDNANTVKPSNFYRSPNFRRQESSEETPVQRLDAYYKQQGVLSVAETNALRDWGFQNAGNVIHEVIKGMGSDDALVKSTRLPFGGDHDRLVTTTEHVHIHQVTPEQPAGSTAPPDVSTAAEAFRYKYRPTHTKSK